MPCNNEKHIFAIYWALWYDMYMCIVRWKMGCLYASNYNSQLYSKSKLKLCICIWAHMTSPRALEATLPFKIASSKCWETAQLSKMLCDDPIWQSNNSSIILYHQSFLLYHLSLTYWKLLPFWRVLDFFPMILKTQSIWLL